MTKQELLHFLGECKVPGYRQDLTRPENLRWLLRNLWVKNQHPKRLNEANAKIEEMLFNMERKDDHQTTTRFPR